MKFQLERILLFSDAVFAIAITLMIIEIKPPHLVHDIPFSDALKELFSKGPIFLGTVLSFYIIGNFWFDHHDLMKDLVTYNTKFVWLNLSLLLSIAFIPFSTSFHFENLESLSPLPFLVYNINNIIANLLNLWIFNYSLNPTNQLCKEDHSQQLRLFNGEMYYSLFVFSTVTIVAFLNTSIAPILYSLFAFQSLILKKVLPKNKMARK